MACLLPSSSFSFSIPFQTLNKEILQRGLVIGRVLGPASWKTSIKLEARNCLNRGLISKSMIDDQHRLKFRRQFVPFSNGPSVSCINTHTVISGFWVAPDAEDGCGFVEAFVDRIV